MKTIGLLGGMSWESTAIYYKLINEGVKSKLGGLHSAKLCMLSVNFEEIETCQRLGQWDKAAVILSDAAQSVEAGGADFLLMCTNTMHRVASDIERAISLPVIHIADATAERLVADNVERVGLLGTRFTMERGFYKDRLTDKFGIEVLVPNADRRRLVHGIIYRELCLGVIRDSSREQYLEVIDGLHKHGAQAIILGCTEIALLVQQAHTSVPLYDTTEIHALKAVALAVSE